MGFSEVSLERALLFSVRLQSSIGCWVKAKVSGRLGGSDIRRTVSGAFLLECHAGARSRSLRFTALQQGPRLDEPYRYPACLVLN